jgi:hypothetical protein
MKRPAPTINSAQAKSVTTASLARAQLDTLAEKEQQEQRALDRKIARLDQRFASQLAWNKRYGHWLARMLLVPLMVIAIGLVTAVVIGVWSGEIKVINRNSSSLVLRADSPVVFWLSVLYHGTLAALLVWLTYHCARASKFRGTRATQPLHRANIQ